MTFSIDNEWTKKVTANEYQCTFGSPCYLSRRYVIRRTGVRGMAAFNGTYEIGYYKSSIIGPDGTGAATPGAVFTEADPMEFPCHFWFFPNITQTVSYFAQAITILGDPAAPCSISTGAESVQTRTATLLLAGGGVLLNGINTPAGDYNTGHSQSNLANYTITDSRSAGCGSGGCASANPTTIDSLITTSRRIDVANLPLCPMWAGYTLGSVVPAIFTLVTIGGQAGYVINAKDICQPNYVQHEREIAAYSDTDVSGTGVASCIAGTPQNTRTVEWTKLAWEMTTTLNA